MPRLLMSTLAATAALAAALPGWAQSYAPGGEQPMGRVVSVRPDYQQVSVPQQVCQDQQAYAGSTNSGLGAIAGAVVGGVFGNSIGGGFGRAAATAVGVVGGAAVGNQLEGGYPQYQTVRQCGTQYVAQNQQTGYTVEYEYANQRFTTHTAQHPGDWIPLTIQPVGSSANVAPPPAAYDNYYAPPPPPQYMAPQPAVVVGAPAPVYYPAPAYAAPVYAAPVIQPVISLGIGGVWGGGHRHWR
ncbi:hypothetical protein GCM10027082_21210 [Comamonas humi]